MAKELDKLFLPALYSVRDLLFIHVHEYRYSCETSFSSYPVCRAYASNRAARKGRNGEISKMVAALEAEELAPLATLAEMRRLHPAPFVPVGCPA